MHRLCARTASLALLGASALALLLVWGGCEKPNEADATETAGTGDKAGESASAHTPRKPEARKVESVPSIAPRLVLLDPGKEPRSELRYTLQRGARETIALDMTMTMQTRAPGLPSTPITLPGIRLVMKVAIEDEVSDEEARYGFEITDAKLTNTEGVAPNVLEKTEPELAKAIGLSGSAVVDVRGFKRDAKIELPAGLSPQMRQLLQGTKQSLDQLSSPLPKEPVGVGARWKAQEKVETNGLSVKQETTYELVELDGTHGKLEATITQTAVRQTAQTPGLPAGVDAELLSFDGSGSGEVRFDLSRLVPDSAQIDVDTRSAYNIKARGNEQSLSMKASTGMRIEHL